MDVINAFLSRTTCKSLIHKLGCLKPRTTHDLLDITTNHASDEEAVEAVFNGGRDKSTLAVSDCNKPTSSLAFYPLEETKAVGIDPTDPTKIVRIGTRLPVK